MFTNPDTFQAIAVDHNKDTNENYTLKASNIEIESKISVKLLGIKTDNKLLRQKNWFIMQKSSQSVACNLQTTKSNGKKKVGKFIKSFVYSNFNYDHLSDIFLVKNRCEKLRKFRRSVCNNLRWLWK